jgi:glutathione S-transferase
VAVGGSVNGLPTLWQITFSHYNEKARWALDYKGVAHRRRSKLPALHVATARRLYGGMTFPVLELDGQAIGGSDKIVETLEQREPERPLYPEHEIQRDMALELERYFGQELGPHIRRYLFYWLLPHGRESSELMAQGFSRPASVAYRAAFPLTRLVIRRSMKITKESAEHSRQKTVAAMDRVEGELGSSGYLVGDAFSVADLSAAALFYPLVRPAGTQYEMPARRPNEAEEFRASQADRDGFKWVEEMWRKHRGTSAAVA